LIPLTITETEIETGKKQSQLK